MEIELMGYFRVIKKRLWLIVVFVLVCTVFTAVFSANTYKPIYQASTKMLLNQTVDTDQFSQQQMGYGGMDVSVGLINTLKEIIKTPTFMDKVVQRYPDLNLSAEQLVSVIDLNGVEGTAIMSIISRSSSYDKAVKINNAVSEVTRTEIPKILRSYTVSVINEAKTKKDPQPVNKKSNYTMIGFMASLVVAIGIALVLDTMDDTLKNEQDIRLAFEVPTLAVITKAKEKDLRQARGKRTSNEVGDSRYATTSR